jgi:hypothetical protein
MQTIELRYWAAARSAAGVASDRIDVDGPVSLAALVSEAVRRRPGPRFAEVLGVCSVLVGERPLGAQDPSEVVVEPGECVEFLPAFAGG